MNLLLEVVLAKAEPSDVLSSVGGDHRVDFGDQAHLITIWIVQILGRGVDSRQSNLDIELDFAVTLDVNSSCLILLRNSTAPAERDHLASAADFKLDVAETFLNSGFEGFAVDFFISFVECKSQPILVMFSA